MSYLSDIQHIIVKFLTLPAQKVRDSNKYEAIIGIDYSKSTVEKFSTSIKRLKEYTFNINTTVNTSI